MKDVKNFADIAFKDEVKKYQEQMGSQKQYSKLDTMEMNIELGPLECAHIKARDSFYMATVNSKGFPYVQFRGGPKGFLKILDEKTVGIIDFGGNRQYISTGNLRENNNVVLFLMNYIDKKRLKIWSETEVLSIDELKEKDLFEKLHNQDYKAKEERGHIFHIKAFDWNCLRYISQKYTLEEISQATWDRTDKRSRRIKEQILKIYV